MFFFMGAPWTQIWFQTCTGAGMSTQKPRRPPQDLHRCKISRGIYFWWLWAGPPAGGHSELAQSDTCMNVLSLRWEIQSDFWYWIRQWNHHRQAMPHHAPLIFRAVSIILWAYCFVFYHYNVSKTIWNHQKWIPREILRRCRSCGGLRGFWVLIPAPVQVWTQICVHGAPIKKNIAIWGG